MDEILDFQYKQQGKDQLSRQKHSHTYHFEILHVYAGSGMMIINEHIFPIKKDTIFFINGMDIHCSVPDDPSSYVRTKLVISSAYIQSIANLTSFSDGIQDLFFHSGGSCIALSPSQALFIDEQMAGIQDALQKHALHPKTAITLCLFHILLCAHENLSHHTLPIHNQMSDVLHYLDEHISARITLDELCAQLHISKYYLCHTFKETLGMTIFDYILAKRIALAKKRLLYTDESISEVSLSTGFSSFSYFSKIFKELEGVSPKDFRKAAINSARTL